MYYVFNIGWILLILLICLLKKMINEELDIVLINIYVLKGMFFVMDCFDLDIKFLIFLMNGINIIY